MKKSIIFFYNSHLLCFFLTSIVTYGLNSVVRNLYFENIDVLRFGDFKTGGRSIRCEK
jgi:hypothetical protein